MPNRRRNRIKNMIGLILLPFVVVLLVRWFERSATFQPFKRHDGSAADLGRPFKDIALDSGSAKIHAWHFPADTNGLHRDKVFLVCHGNAGNISHRLDLATTLLETGAGVLLFDYRGYGQSSGRPTEAGLYADARAAYDYLRDQGHAATNIILFGESLGGAVAAQLASTTEVGGLVLLSTFTSIPDVGAEIFPWIPRFLGSLRFNSLERIPKINAPVLIIHSRADSIIRFAHAEKLLAAANEPKQLVEIKPDHNETFADAADEVREALLDFLGR